MFNDVTFRQILLPTLDNVNDYVEHIEKVGKLQLIKIIRQ